MHKLQFILVSSKPPLQVLQFWWHFLNVDKLIKKIELLNKNNKDNSYNLLRDIVTLPFKINDNDNKFNKLFKT